MGELHALYTYKEIKAGEYPELKDFAIELDNTLSIIIDSKTQLPPSVQELLKFGTIENLYSHDLKVYTKLKPGCVDMRNVMSKPFCIENLYYAKHEPVDEATLDEFNQNTGNNVKKADVYLSRKALKEVQKPQVQVVTEKGI